MLMWLIAFYVSLKQFATETIKELTYSLTTFYELKISSFFMNQMGINVSQKFVLFTSNCIPSIFYYLVEAHQCSVFHDYRCKKKKKKKNSVANSIIIFFKTFISDFSLRG